MGNQREIRQVSPREGLGVLVRVREGHSAEGERVAETPEHRGYFYTYFCPAGEPIDITNMDFDPPIRQDSSKHHHVAIQSGGKMWCGYEQFVEQVRKLAPHLENAHFSVGDEEDYIDEFLIVEGRLEYKRVHEGCWWSLQDFLASRGLADEA